MPTNKELKSLEAQYNDLLAEIEKNRKNSTVYTELNAERIKVGQQLKRAKERTNTGSNESKEKKVKQKSSSQQQPAEKTVYSEQQPSKTQNKQNTQKRNYKAEIMELQQQKRNTKNQDVAEKIDRQIDKLRELQNAEKDKQQSSLEKAPAKKQNKQVHKSEVSANRNDTLSQAKPKQQPSIQKSPVTEQRRSAPEEKSAESLKQQKENLMIQNRRNTQANLENGSIGRTEFALKDVQDELAKHVKRNKSFVGKFVNLFRKGKIKKLMNQQVALESELARKKQKNAELDKPSFNVQTHDAIKQSKQLNNAQQLGNPSKAINHQH